MCDLRWLMVLKEKSQRSQLNGRLELSWRSFKCFSSVSCEENRKPHWEQTNRQLCFLTCITISSTSTLHSKHIFSGFLMMKLCLVAIWFAAFAFEPNFDRHWKHWNRFVFCFFCEMPLHREMWLRWSKAPYRNFNRHFGHSFGTTSPLLWLFFSCTWALNLVVKLLPQIELTEKKIRRFKVESIKTYQWYGLSPSCLVLIWRFKDSAFNKSSQCGHFIFSMSSWRVMWMSRLRFAEYFLPQRSHQKGPA